MSQAEIEDEPRRFNVLRYVTSNKIFTLILVRQIAQVAFTVFLSSGVVAGLLSPVSTWCVLFAIFLRRRLSSIADRGL